MVRHLSFRYFFATSTIGTPALAARLPISVSSSDGGPSWRRNFNGSMSSIMHSVVPLMLAEEVEEVSDDDDDESHDEVDDDARRGGIHNFCAMGFVIRGCGPRPRPTRTYRRCSWRSPGPVHWGAPRTRMQRDEAFVPLA
jgi:hypothetical protein